MSTHDRLSVSMGSAGGEVSIGTMTRDASGFIKFEFDESYIQIGSRRPTLSAAWIHVDDEQKTIERLRSTDGKIGGNRSEEHTSELQSLMRISYAVFCLK